MIPRATVPTILVTIGAVTQRVTCTLLSGLLGFLELLFELLKFLVQKSYLARVTTALFQGFFAELKGL